MTKKILILEYSDFSIVSDFGIRGLNFKQIPVMVSQLVVLLRQFLRFG